MKKTLAAILSVVLMLAVASPAYAEEAIFIPSNGVEVLRAELAGEDVKDCVVVTSVIQALDKNTDITQEARDLLLQVNDDLADGTMKLPVGGQFRYLELADLSFAENACVQNADHENKYEILSNDNPLTLEVELEFVPEGKLMVLTYVDEEWKIVENAMDMGNGKVVCVFEEICPVVFIDVDGEGGSEGPNENVDIDAEGYPVDAMSFVPSITYKDGLDITDLESNIEIEGGNNWGTGIDQCVVVTSIAQAEEKSTDISQEDRDLLLEVYEALANGEMELPVKEDYVIRDLVDISFEYEDCRCQEEHGHKDECLAEEEITLTITFDMDLEEDEEVIVMAYVDGEWGAIKSVENNGDGTVTCIFEDICPVAFIVNEPANTTGPQTGDSVGQNMWMWMMVMAGCVVGITGLLVMKRRKTA